MSLSQLKDSQMGAIQHPGHPITQRHQAQLCHATPIPLLLKGGQSLHDAIIKELSVHNITSAYITLNHAQMDTLRYVIPGDDPKGEHAAWYSDTCHLGAPAQILTAGIHVGRREGKPFMHCHGTWSGVSGKDKGKEERAQVVAGHLLAPESYLAEDSQVACIAIEGACLDVHYDEETRFPLFSPNTTLSNINKKNALLLTLRPNQDLQTAIASIANDYRVKTAQILGIGSLIKTCFNDGKQLLTHANEILILNGELKDHQATIQAVSVGIGGEQHQGQLAPGKNAICVTCELLLVF